MIKSFDFSHSITQNDEKRCKKIVDDLFESGNWCREVPTFQTWPNLYAYKEFDSFVDTFIQACSLFLNKRVKQKQLRFWCYMDYKENYLKKNPEDLWHQHGDIDENKLSGIYYLINPDNLTTEFKDYSVEEANPFTWYIYPSHYLHRPPEITSPEKRYTLAADLSF